MSSDGTLIQGIQNVHSTLPEINEKCCHSGGLVARAYLLDETDQTWVNTAQAAREARSHQSHLNSTTTSSHVLSNLQLRG
jgi:hypothetical protein